MLLSLALADRNNYFRSALRGPGCNIEDGAGKRTGDADSVLVRMEKRDSEMRKELELAADIQQGILPQMPWSAEGINIEAHTLSMGRVGGDFYDVFRMQGGHTES